MDILGSHICPMVIGLTSSGYSMEYLEPDVARPETLRTLESALSAHVWSRDPIDKENTNWLDLLVERLRVPLPAPPGHLTAPCLTHGDCTVSNLGRRENGGRLLVMDPLPPRPYIPERREVDMGRILQSACGWETLVYGDDVVDFDPPDFWFVDYLRRPALWWCGVTALRIARHEDGRRDNVMRWCQEISRMCFDALDI